MNSKFKIQNSTFPRYDRYKDSGVEWLGEIPEHWEPFRAKHVFRNVSEKGFPDEPLLSATQDRGVVPRDQLEQRVVMPVGQLQTFKLVREDNFVISLSSFQGVIEHCAYQGLVSPAYTVLRLQRDVNPRFLRHLLRASNFISELNISVTGIRQGKNIDYGDFAESILPIPPKPEQDRIVTFLDRKTAEIDALIAKKQRQIELLDEQKAILINRAVTRGLNPNAKLKPSGIEWIGEIPENWQVDRLFSIFNERVETGHGHLPMLNITISRGVSVEDFDGDRPKRLIEDRNSYKRAAVGDIAYNMMRMWQGAVGNVNTEGLVSPAYVVARPIRDINSFYFSSMFRGKAFQIETNKFSYGIVTDRNRLYWLGFKSIFVPLPPKAEQDAIAEHITNIQEVIKKSQTALQGQIENFKTLRSTLIAHTVTGRLKV